MKFLKTFEAYNDATLVNGPSIMYNPKSDPSIGIFGGENGGIIGGSDAGGEFFKTGGVTAKPERDRIKPFSVYKDVIRKKKKEKLAKIIKRLNIKSYDEFNDN